MTMWPRWSRILLCFLLFLFVAFLIHFQLSGLTSEGQSQGQGQPDLWKLSEENADIARKTLGLLEFNHLSGPELADRIKELVRIKNSVQVELLGLEKRRNEMQAQISAFHRKIEDLKSEATKEQMELERLGLSVDQAKLSLDEYRKRNTPNIKLPLPLGVLTASKRDNVKLEPPKDGQDCHMENCFDYSRCSFTSGFPVYLYDRKWHPWFSGLNLTPNPDEACIFVLMSSQSEINSRELSHWNGDGRNHVVFLLGGKNVVNSQRAIIVKTNVDNTFRSHFDLVLPHLSNETSDSWSLQPDLLSKKSNSSVWRQFLVSFQGQKILNEAENQVFRIIESINEDTTDDTSYIKKACSEDQASYTKDDWRVCGNEVDRSQILIQSTFVVIFAPETGSTDSFQLRLYESLKYGSIPVIIGLSSRETTLPLSEVIDWNNAAIFIATAQVTELHAKLRSLTETHIFQMKKQGSLIWRNYLYSKSLVLPNLLHVIRERLFIPPPAFQEEIAELVYKETDMPRRGLLPSELEMSQMTEPLGPLEPPKPSLAFKSNFSITLFDSYDRWNSHFNPFFMAPYTPWEPLLPTDAKFLGSSSGFRPIGNGSGGSGREFSQALGGNSPAEQFTVVMLTYEREQELIKSLIRLHRLPYLNKVVVIWNSEEPPSEELKWPDIGVPIVPVRANKNSLNNRFLPYDVIETEAVLSVDDDTHLRKDEIDLAFRTWREHRDQIVGFPGRFHAWDWNHNSWNYNSNYSCQLSMVLTGAAFYHKYYNYVYTYLMPQPIRQKVDQFMNCEDLAMNFLVSHVTGKPPVKVTSRWTFRCPDCPVNLSDDDSHFQERHECINFFKRVFGYMPLKYTQCYVDSMLFKTRIPVEQQKCYKFM